jgi:hypothetical protein
MASLRCKKIFGGLSSNGSELLGKDRAPCSALLFEEASDYAQQLHRAVGLRDIDCAGRGCRALSPLGHEHINMLGRYAVTLPDLVARGELRPLRDPNQLVDEAA